MRGHCILTHGFESGPDATKVTALADVAERLGIRYFTQFDDDYTAFNHRMNGDGSYGTSRIKDMDAVLDANLGPKPEKFTWKGKEYTPQSFAASLGLDMDDYVEISSYTHHPFYEEFILEGWNDIPPYRRDFDTLKYAEASYSQRPGRETRDPATHMKQQLYPGEA